MLGSRIEQLRKNKSMTQKDLAEKLSLSPKAISFYELGQRSPSYDTVQALAKIFEVSPAYLLGWIDEEGNLVQQEITIPEQFKKLGWNHPSPAPRRINVYGRIPAGVPLEAITDIIDWEDIPGTWTGDYIALQVQGDSMEPEYRESDVIIVKVQPDCESGQDCVVYVNGYDATLKRVVKQQTCIMLQPLNPAYEPKIYDYTDPEGVTILGVVVEMRRKKG